MIQPISYERWQQAQKAERACHKLGFNEGIGHYYWAYRNIFNYLKIPLINDRVVIEIGPADFPALMFCDTRESIVIEPMPSPFLKQICERCKIMLITTPVEDLCMPRAQEIWVFNVLQHVIDPEWFIKQCKIIKTVRFFEPINQPACEYHPHSPIEEDFRRWFGDCVRIYDDKLPNFFDDKCAYGTWINNA